jgi:DNA-binding transcriptional LysR family regulator
MSLAISQHTEDYISNLVLTPLEIVFNKPHPSILLHIKDATTQEVLILLQETKTDIIFRHAQLQTQRRREELHPCIQARLVLVVNKIIAVHYHSRGSMKLNACILLLAHMVYL